VGQPAWNRYAYVSNQSLTNIDPLGLDMECILCLELSAVNRDIDFSAEHIQDLEDRSTFGDQYYYLPGHANETQAAKLAYLRDMYGENNVQTGSAGLIIRLEISFWGPFQGICPESAFCIGRFSYNLFEFTDPQATKTFSFDTSFDGAVIAFGRKGILPSPGDNKYNVLHDFSLRDSKEYCSFHVDLKSHAGIPTTGSIHIDGINPNINFGDRVLHGAGDLLPDFLRKVGLPVPGAASECR
jgi:hypothetical protein